MEIRPIRSRADYRATLKAVDRLWDAEPGTPAGDRVEVLATLIEAYEAKHFPPRIGNSWYFLWTRRIFLSLTTIPSRRSCWPRRR